MDKLIKLLSKNARLSNAQLAGILNTSEENVKREIVDLEKKGVIKGYRAVINYDKLDDDSVMAIIELKVTPKTNLGFDDVANYIAQMEEVESIHLMSGGYDLAIIMRAHSFKEIAMFVFDRLAAIESVESTATHFVLTTYKDGGFLIESSDAEEGRSAWLA